MRSIWNRDRSMTPQNLVPHTVTPFTETHTKKTKSHPYRKDVEECSNPLTS